MAAALDMTLDDIIKQNKKSAGDGVDGGGRRARPRGGSGAGGPVRRPPRNRSGNRSNPYSLPQAPDSGWQHDMFVDDVRPAPARAPAIHTGTKLFISNLDFGVSTDDIKELFQEIGDLKRFLIHYDERTGRSLGTAEVVFARRADAIKAIENYNNVMLDGKPIKVVIEEKPTIAPSVFSGPSRSINDASKSKLNRGPAQRPQGGGGGPAQRPTQGGGGPTQGGGGRARGRVGGGGGGRGRAAKERKAPVSAEDLDKDLDNYHAMQTN